ncbi:glycosyltransferase [Microbacterium sp. NPDC077184]|uniref:glycosyltransferase family 2 protein n=1 Tax=Microbacterium sp. NPDC077184 TaxID=3154764 RepID=UPI003430A427
MSLRLLITVCTYGRPDGLRRLLTSLEGERSDEVDVLVVDNNPVGVDYLDSIRRDFPWALIEVERTPGIPAARNKALDQATGYWAILFVDDDEFVTPGWLKAHTRYAEESDADVFFGPVLSEYSPGADHRVVDGGILQRDRHPTGLELPFGATNNTLVKVKAIPAAVRFSEGFTESGGSDVHFFANLRAYGAKLVWNDNPVVYEAIPADRATVHWVRRRYMRMGSNLVSLHQDSTRARLYASAMARILVGAALRPTEWTPRRLRKAASGRIWMGLGMLQALRGTTHVEYVRNESVGSDA